ncbi:hypothetical protein [Peptostreptococcus equinus]|uniref:DUF2975 domain-containing protein n=1 Tax=Peptostreptococcus equinus TaxID=3003601 RepID=A0ABY7JR15_9FIRM|nr:hypothetical protein [Peptostreptococcus sp. CBA3647]WAW15807.1 hypothetical protein O0R46_04965 [Peptostreptococcus sp. CBA3647]
MNSHRIFTKKNNNETDNNKKFNIIEELIVSLTILLLIMVLSLSLPNLIYKINQGFYIHRCYKVVHEIIFNITIAGLIITLLIIKSLKSNFIQSIYYLLYILAIINIILSPISGLSLDYPIIGFELIQLKPNFNLDVWLFISGLLYLTFAIILKVGYKSLKNNDGTL